jgi:hypothetical protein
MLPMHINGVLNKWTTHEWLVKNQQINNDLSEQQITNMNNQLKTIMNNSNQPTENQWTTSKQPLNNKQPAN